MPTHFYSPPRKSATAQSRERTIWLGIKQSIRGDLFHRRQTFRLATREIAPHAR
jgi:hypothetical protein